MRELPEQLRRAFQDAFNRHDVDEVLSLNASDAVLVGPSGSVQGTGAIRERFRNFFEMKPTIALQTLT
jgi:ketosteroid isomerase-like protein